MFACLSFNAGRKSLGGCAETRGVGIERLGLQIVRGDWMRNGDIAGTSAAILYVIC